MADDERFTIQDVIARLGGSSQPATPTPATPTPQASSVEAIATAVVQALSKRDSGPSTGPDVPPPMAPSAPSTVVPMQREAGVFDMSPEAIQEFMRKNGAPEPWAPYSPKNRAQRRMIRNMVDQALHTKRISMGYRKGS